MKPERHQQICDLLYQALQLAPNERTSFLNQACSSHSTLRQEVESLLASREEVRSTFLRSSALRWTLKPGSRVGEYQVESMLGSGGMGEVYRARDPRLERSVAIKVLPSYMSADRDRLHRFEREARAAAALNHPNILAVFQMGTHEGAPYLVSELLEGETLRAQIRRGRLAPQKVINFSLQIAKGLAAAHEKGIIHRDLKPENLFVTTDAQIKILDFGLAKLTENPRDLSGIVSGASKSGNLATEPGVIMGTAGYMSPEQARGQPSDARSDIFAFGAVLYEMLTAKSPFQRDTPVDTLSAILHERPPAIPRSIASQFAGLNRVINRCLEKTPDQRYQSASDLFRDLEAQSPRSNRWKLMVSAAAIVVLLTVAALNFRGSLSHLVPPRFLHAPAQPSSLIERNLTANPAENPVRAVALTRDGKYVAYADNAEKVHLLLVDSGDVHDLPLDSNDEPVDWFPDGLHLLLRREGAQPGLWKFSTWDSGLKKLWDGFVGEVAVSVDGSKIAFVNGEDRHEIWMMGAEGEEPHKVLGFAAEDSIWGIAWSPSGKNLAYIRLRGSYTKHETVIETCDAGDGGRTVVLSEPRLWGRDGVLGLSWLPDGRIIYSISTRLDEYNLWSVMAGPDGRGRTGEPQAVTGWRDFSAKDFRATADGKRMVALKTHSEDGIYVGGLAKSARFDVRRITADNWRNTVTGWTSDSKSVLLFSKRNGRWAICRQDLDAKMPETLITGPENYRDPVVNAAGTLLYTAFASADVDTASGNWRLMSTSLDGGPRSVLLDGRYSYQCGNTPSSPCVMGELHDNQLVFSTLDPIHGRGGELGRISDVGLPRWSLSPDGSHIALIDTSREQGTIQILNLNTRELTARPVRDWKWQNLTAATWAGDSERLFATVLSKSSSAIVTVYPDGTATILHEVDPAQAWLGVPTASPDGRFLAFTKRTYVSDAVLLENF